MTGNFPLALTALCIVVAVRVVTHVSFATCPRTGGIALARTWYTIGELSSRLGSCRGKARLAEVEAQIRALAAVRTELSEWRQRMASLLTENTGGDRLP